MGVQHGRHVLRSAPWRPLVGASAMAGVLLGAAALAPGSAVTFPLTLLGLAAAGSAAAYTLDEDSADVADATPSSRPRRTAWRLAVVALPSAVAVAGLAALAGADPGVPWLRLAPLATGALAVGLTLAAVLRRRGSPAPGDLAAAVVVCVTVLVVAVDPLRRWVTVAPLDEGAAVGRSVALWLGVVLGCAVVVARCSADPGRPARRPRRASRRSVVHPLRRGAPPGPAASPENHRRATTTVASRPPHV